MNDSVTKVSTGVGLGLLAVFFLCYVGGVIAVIYFGITSDEVPFFVKLMLGGLILGVGILFLTVLRQRLIEWKTDKYKDVEL